MSTTLSTQAMVADLQTRFPNGASAGFWMDRLNEAFRRLSQKGAFTWNLKTTSVTVLGGGVTFSLPSDMDPGAPMYLVGPTNWRAEIPYFPWERASKMSVTDQTVSAGQFGAWSIVGTTGYLFPLAASAPGAVLTFYYHSRVGAPLTSGPATYFPTPDEFDTVIVEMAESEGRRRYESVGWEIPQKRADESLVSLLDRYRSSREVLVGLAEQDRQAQELSAKRAEG